MSEEVEDFRAHVSHRRYNVGYATIHWNARMTEEIRRIFEVLSWIRSNPLCFGFRDKHIKEILQNTIKSIENIEHMCYSNNSICE